MESTQHDTYCITDQEYYYKVISHIVHCNCGVLCIDENEEKKEEENVTQFSFRTEKFRKSLFPDCIRKWNELPVDLWKIVKLDDFMNEITIPLKIKQSLLWHQKETRGNSFPVQNAT